MAQNLVAVPARPNGVQPAIKVNRDLTQEFIVANSYTAGQRRILAATEDDIELEVSLRTYERMERDSAIKRCKKIWVTSVLADDLQLAPGASEEHVGPDEYDTYVAVMELCQRSLDGLDRPIRETLEQILGNGIKYGNGVAEVEYEHRLDGPSSKPVETKVPAKSRLSAMASKIGVWLGTSDPTIEASEGKLARPVLQNQSTRLMPASIKVKPRGATRFVVDDFMSLLGLVPARTHNVSTLTFNEIIDRDKFLVYTLDKQDEDPRGHSAYRPAVNWYNLKTQVPSEMLRYILEELVPKAVATLPENMPAFEFERDDQGQIVYEDPETKKVPKMRTSAESFKAQIEGFRGGSGAVIPHGATLEPYKKGMTGASDGDLFTKILKVINLETENAILLQSLAQSEGEHQSKSASQQVAEVLYNLVFWTRWQLAMLVLYDLFSVVVKVNLGEWALRYLPLVSLGDFTRRDWVIELEALADAYFKGLLDDSQRPEIMSSLNLPRPGPSRAETAAANPAPANQDINGEPIQPNSNRPDKQPGNKNRNDGNGTDKKNVNKQRTNTGRGSFNLLGHDSGWFGRPSSHL